MTPAPAYPPRDHSPGALSQRGVVEGGRARQPNRLAPEDAFYAASPPRGPLHLGLAETSANDMNGSAQRHLIRALSDGHRRRERGRGRSGSRKAKGVWKKLLWVKQSYPDNYTDEETFLDHLQRNPRLQPYEFWPLVADSTVIVQHVCTVAIFACCFVGIFQDRISPVAVVGWGNFATVLGWAFCDRWVGQETNGLASDTSLAHESSAGSTNGPSTGSGSHTVTEAAMKSADPTMLAGKDDSGSLRNGDTAHYPSSSSTPTTVVSGHPTGATRFANYSSYPPYGASASVLSPRNQQRLATAKSACLIYCALLGLSPILKSLTKSTTSDSIWAMSCWLMCINVFFFDYGGAVDAKFPASLSTNAALMASTVLASRLPSTTHVFSLTLFSIEVFGLFPVFRRHLRRISWHGHLTLTFALVTCAGGGMGITISGGGWQAATAGVILGWLFTGLTMGVCSWWLIGLQKYKNEIHGPWDPARPVIRRHWD